MTATSFEVRIASNVKTLTTSCEKHVKTMSWIVDNTLTWFQKFCVNVLKCGPVPRHIAFIMDGNRRYATKANVQKAEGHTKGFEKLAETLQWCRELGVQEVTVYAFSIENFKRSEQEVETLMQLAREKFQRLLDEEEKLMTEGVCIRVIGNLELLPADVRKLIAKAVLLTKNNNKCFLNVAFAYTARDELTNSIKCAVNGVKTKAIEVDDITEQLITDCLYTNKRPDILVRTSGEVRFSDFLLWQIWNTNICFTEVLWPEFCIWHLLASVFQYQRCLPHLETFKRISEGVEGEEGQSPRVKQFLLDLEGSRLRQLEVYASSN